MNRAAEDWETLKAEFYRDGSLRDIYVVATGLDDWKRLASYLVDAKYRFRFSGAWSNDGFPENLASLFPTGPESLLTVLSIDVAGVTLNCHFFSEDEIEFDLDPAEVDDPAKLEAVFGFMSGVANALDKEVVLTPENMREIRIFLVHPQTGRIEHTPFGGFQ